jgi:hypothetical protein
MPYEHIMDEKRVNETMRMKRGVEIVSYTEPRGTRFDIEGGKVLRNSSPVKVNFELQRRTDS